MRWTSLGHACWLLEGGGLRVLFDPVLGDTHHAGVFRVVPPRRIDLDRLRPDVVVLSHRHPDHFDLPSLDALASRWPDALLVTADPLVAYAARALGFRDARVLPARHRLDLGGLRCFTTPSFCRVVEWGFLVATGDGVTWNQVDTVLTDGPTVRRVLDEGAAALGSRARPDLALVRWQPLQQAGAALSGRSGFPHQAWAAELQRVVALRAAHLIPSAAGVGYAPEFGWLDAVATPATEAAFLRDVAVVAPATRAWPSRTGGRWVVADGDVHDDGASDLVEVSAHTAAPFAPYVLPPLRDDVEVHVDDRALAMRWVREVLPRSLARAWPLAGVPRPISHVLEVVWAGGAEVVTLVAGPDGCAVHDGDDPDFDIRNSVVGSALVDVLAGHAPWGRPLLGGQLRGVSRAMVVTPDGARPASVQTLFVYHALPYETSFERWIAWQLRERPWRS